MEHQYKYLYYIFNPVSSNESYVAIVMQYTKYTFNILIKNVFIIQIDFFFPNYKLKFNTKYLLTRKLSIHLNSTQIFQSEITLSLSIRSFAFFYLLIFFHTLPLHFTRSIEKNRIRSFSFPAGGFLDGGKIAYSQKYKFLIIFYSALITGIIKVINSQNMINFFPNSNVAQKKATIRE